MVEIELIENKLFTDDGKYVTRYELECKLREIDHKLSASLKDAGNDSSKKNGILTVRADKDMDDVSIRLNNISDRLDKFLLAIIGLSITTLVSVILMLASFILRG